MLDDDLDHYLEDHGVPCICGAVSFLGIKDVSAEDLGGSGLTAQSITVMLTVKTSDITLANIRHGVAITVDGVAFNARNPAPVDDGSFSMIPLTKA